MFDSMQELAIRQLETLDASTRLIVLHPGYDGKRLLLQYLLGQKGSVYLRLDGDALSRTALDAQLDAAMGEQQDDMARDGVQQLILDECDRAKAADFDSFLKSLLTRFPKIRIVIQTRLTPSYVFTDAELRAATRFIPVDPTMVLPDYTQQDADITHLEVSAFGGGRVLLNGRLIDEWDGTLPRALFFFMVDKGMMTRSKIFETFWPGLSTREATNVFHVTKRKISEVLGLDLTVYWSGFYHLSSRINLVYDTAIFAEMVQNSAVASAEDSVVLLSKALSLYRGDYLVSLEGDWVLSRRQELRQTYGEVLIGLAKAMERDDKPRHALGYYLRAAVTNPQREDIARSIMQLYYKLGMAEDALATYDRLESELERTLNVSPLPAIQELAASIREAREDLPAKVR